MSPRRAELLRKRQAKKEAKRKKQGNPGGESTYAKKKRGIYPPNSPYRTIWA